VSKLSSPATVLLACTVPAQSTFGSIVGVVNDPGALVIPSAKITLAGGENKTT
jgi:hypothetical protein